LTLNQNPFFEMASNRKGLPEQCPAGLSIFSQR
jgi:hypothetical protein